MTPQQFIQSGLQLIKRGGEYLLAVPNGIPGLRSGVTHIDPSMYNQLVSSGVQPLEVRRQQVGDPNRNEFIWVDQNGNRPNIDFDTSRADFRNFSEIERLVQNAYQIKENERIEGENKVKAQKFNAFVDANRNSPTAVPVPPELSPDGQSYVVGKGSLFTQDAFNKKFGNDPTVVGSTAYYKDQVAKGLMKEVQVGNGVSYIPTGSPADVLRSQGEEAMYSGTYDPKYGTASRPSAPRTLDALGGQGGGSMGGGFGGGLGGGGQIYRDANDNFFLDGRKIELDEFKRLGINADFVPRGSTVSMQVAVGGQGPDLSGLPPELVALYDTLKTQLEELKKRGQNINPNVEITPEKAAEFLTQASKEIDPYYATQAKLVRDQLLTSLGYSKEDILRQEQDIERIYGKQLRGIGDESAETGFALSGRRQLAEKELSEGTQRDLDQGRRSLAFKAGDAAGNYAQQYGSASIPGVNISETPRVIAGQEKFARSSRELPFYQLSNDVYDGLIGSKEFERRGAVKSRAYELEEAYRTQLANNQLRQLS